MKMRGRSNEMPHQQLKPESFLDEERLASLNSLVPEAFADNKINWSTLKDALGGDLEDEEKSDEHFGLFWPGKREARKLAGRPSKGALVPVKGEGIDEQTTGNIFIEGENLEVLKILRKSYSGRIKMIYIDPPYNTGNDFVYDDDFTEPLVDYLKRTGQIDGEGRPLTTNKKADGRFHSKWLSMMYPRLRLARELLQDDGVIFVSIDDNEVHHLRMMMNEVFGEENFVASIANINNPKGRSDDKYVAKAHEYLLIYGKVSPALFGWDPEHKVIKRYNKKDNIGQYREIDLRKTGDNDRREDRPNLFYYFFYNEQNHDLILSRNANTPPGYIKIIPTRQDGNEGNWRWELETSQRKINFLIPKLMPVRNKWSVFEKDYLTEDKTVKPTTAWTHKFVNSERGPEDLVKLDFSKEIFPSPKPVGLLNAILKMSVNPKDLILDFFAGSATTAQAVLDLNKEDGGNRKFILVQMPEATDEKSEAFKAGYKNIAEIGKERIRRVIKKIESEQKESSKKKKEELSGLSEESGEQDLGFKVFKLTSSHYRPWENYHGEDIGRVEELFEQYQVPLVANWKEIEDGLFTEILLLEGFPLESTTVEMPEYSKNRIRQVECSFHENRLLVCFDDKLSAETIRSLELKDGDTFVCLDTGIDDQAKSRLADKGMIKTI
jgi:adenine-specific DNA-methyltransferase